MDRKDLDLLARIGILGLFFVLGVLTVAAVMGLGWRVFWILAGI